MKQIIQLGAKDIQQIIAKEFDIKEEQVSVSLNSVYSGLEMEEHKNYEIYVTVNIW